MRTLVAADENNIPFLASAITFDALLAAVPLLVLSLAVLAQVVQGMAGGGPIDPRDLFERFLPPHDQAAGADPFASVEAILGRLATAGKTLQVVAIPAFLWFSTRLFAGVRTALSNIYDVSVRPPKGHYLLRYVLAKLRDLRMVLMSLVLFLAYTTLTSGISVLRNAGFTHQLDSRVVTLLSSWVVGLVAFGFLTAFFFLLYRYASVRRITWQAALVASGFVAVGFEIARRLFSLYLRSVAGYGTAAADASVGAIVLFVVWLYYSALVFLLGGVVAETWEMRQLQRVQRGEPRQA